MEIMTYELAFHGPHGELLMKEWAYRPSHVLAAAYAAQRVQQSGAWYGVRLSTGSELIAALTREPAPRAEVMA